MSNAIALAQEARRTGIVAALRSQPTMALSQLMSLVTSGKYAAELGDIRIEELGSDSPILRIEPGETVEDAVTRLFRKFEGKWLSSQFFARYLGLERWTAQKICGELAELGLVERRGVTSGTRYRWLEPEPAH